MGKKKAKIWNEDELIDTFSLQREGRMLLLDNWLKTTPTQLNELEEAFLEELLTLAVRKIDFWNEESLKMNFVAPLLQLFVKFNDTQFRYESFFDKEISATVENIYLQTEVDFMLAKGVGDIVKTPYFHFQEYKRSKKSPPEPMAQLIEAFLIAQEKNKNGKPLYGLTITGRNWQFVVMEGKKYAVSFTYDATNKEDLMKIIAVLRKFKVILETTLLD